MTRLIAIITAVLAVVFMPCPVLGGSQLPTGGIATLRGTLTSSNPAVRVPNGMKLTVSNRLSLKDTVFDIDVDSLGRFGITFPLPHMQEVKLNVLWNPIFISPGDTVTITPDLYHPTPSRDKDAIALFRHITLNPFNASKWTQAEASQFVSETVAVMQKTLGTRDTIAGNPSDECERINAVAYGLSRLLEAWSNYHKSPLNEGVGCDRHHSGLFLDPLLELMAKYPVSLTDNPVLLLAHTRSAYIVEQLALLAQSEWWHSQGAEALLEGIQPHSLLARLLARRLEAVPLDNQAASKMKCNVK